MPVLMLMLITLLNDGTIMSIGYDNVIPIKTPEKWNIPALFFISSVLAAVTLSSSIFLLWILLDSWNTNGVFHAFGMGGLSYGQVTTSIYLNVSVNAFLTLFSARCGDHFFWQSRPSNVVLGAAAFSFTCTTILALAWPASYPDGIYTLGLAYRKPGPLFLWIWIYSIVWWLVQDAVKVYTFYLMEKYNWFGINDTGKLVLPESTLEYIRKNKERDMEAKVSGHH